MDIIERLNEVIRAEFEVAQSMDIHPTDTANHRYATTCREAVEIIERLRADTDWLRIALRSISQRCSYGSMTAAAADAKKIADDTLGQFTRK